MHVLLMFALIERHQRRYSGRGLVEKGSSHRRCASRCRLRRRMSRPERVADVDEIRTGRAVGGFCIAAMQIPVFFEFLSRLFRKGRKSLSDRALGEIRAQAADPGPSAGRVSPPTRAAACRITRSSRRTASRAVAKSRTFQVCQPTLLGVRAKPQRRGADAAG